MATYVLVPGGWSGGWQWRQVARLLQARGQEVFTPTLTGLGERVHLATPEVGIDTHIQDIVNVLEYEDLHEVVLLGYSFSGMVVTGVAERVPERIRHLVFLDAFVPEGGQSLADLAGPELRAVFTQIAQVHGNGWLVPHDPPDAPKRTPQPLKPLLEAVSVQNPRASDIPRTYIYCTDKAAGTTDNPVWAAVMGIIAQTAAKARGAGWRYRELNTGHSPWETAPRELADVLLEIT